VRISRIFCCRKHNAERFLPGGAAVKRAEKG